MEKKAFKQYFQVQSRFEDLQRMLTSVVIKQHVAGIFVQIWVTRDVVCSNAPEKGAIRKLRDHNECKRVDSDGLDQKYAACLQQDNNTRD